MTRLLVKSADRDKALALFTTAARAAQECVLRTNGEAVGPASRDEMLAKCAAGEYVELELEVLAYEQQAGVANRNFVRFRDGALVALGRTGKGMPFLRDHRQNDALARGGTIVDSQAEKRGEGDYALRQTVKLTAPWAVELALRGLLSTVSIGWSATGDVLCSVCNAAIYTKCYHWPGDRLSMKENDVGEKKLVRDRSGDLVVEWVYTAAELVETSVVSVPAVPSAHIEAIRASLSAHNGDQPPHGETMDPKSFALLGLAATAGDDEIFKAVDSLVTSKKLVEQQRDELSARTVALEAQVASHAQVAAKQAEERFIDEGVRAGKIMPASPFEAALRAYHQKDAPGATALLASSPVVTPVGQPPQSGGTPPPIDKTPSLSSASAKIAALGGSIDKVRKNLLAAGLTDAEIDATLAKAANDGKAA